MCTEHFAIRDAMKSLPDMDFQYVRSSSSSLHHIVVVLRNSTSATVCARQRVSHQDRTAQACRRNKDLCNNIDTFGTLHWRRSTLKFAQITRLQFLQLRMVSWKLT
jgi:hypothetical protein